MAALTFDDVPNQGKSGALTFDDVPAAKKEQGSGFSQGVGNLVAGLVRGAGSIGATILTPIDAAARAVGVENSIIGRKDRREAMDSALQDLGAQPDSVMYQGGKLAGEIAGTAGVPGVLGKAAQTAGAAPKIVNALSSGGFNLGTPAATNLAGKVGNAAIRVGAGGAVGGSSAGLVNPEDASVGAVIGAALPPAVKAAGEAGRSIRSGVSNVLGATTGTSAETVRSAFSAGKNGQSEFVKNMRGQSEFGDVVENAKQGLARMRESRAAQYRSGMVDISNDKSVLDMTPIENAMNRVVSIGRFKGVQTNKHAADVVDELAGKIAEWRSLNPAEYHTPEGLDALKRAIGDIRDSTQFGSPSRRAADAVYNSVKDEIVKQAPTYSKVMGDYAKASSTLDEVTRALSLGDKSSQDTAIRKLQSLMRNNAQTNYGNRLSLANELEQQGGVSLTPAIAGQAMNSFMPRGMVGAVEKAGLAGLGGAAIFSPAILKALALAPMASPRAVGEASYALGKATGGTTRLGQAIASLPSNEAKQIIDGSMRVAPIIGLVGQKDRQ